MRVPERRAQEIKAETPGMRACDDITRLEGHDRGAFGKAIWSVAPGDAETGAHGGIVPPPGTRGRLASTADAPTTRLARRDIAAAFIAPAICNTGFRLRPDSASQPFGASPDVTILGQAIASGLSVASRAVHAAGDTEEIRPRETRN